jgi:hypothetical protein
MFFNALFKKRKKIEGMVVKGTAVKSTATFVKTNFPKQYDTWLNSLSPESRAIFASSIEIPKWYPLKHAYLDPIDKINELFYNGNPQAGGEAMGHFAADFALKGVYKMFLAVATTNYIISRAPIIITTFFNPVKVKVIDRTKKSMTVVISDFTEISVAAEYRIAAWNQRIIELTNVKNVVYEFKSSMAAGDKKLALKYTWE